MRKLYYLASPYTHPDEATRMSRFEAVSKLAADLLTVGVFTFSPIAYSHPMVKYQLPSDWGFWEEYDTVFLQRCDGLIVLQLPGWETSVGVQAEIRIAKQLNLKIYFYNSTSIDDLLKILA